jgi:hypothetical protein
VAHPRAKPAIGAKAPFPDFVELLWRRRLARRRIPSPAALASIAQACRREPKPRDMPDLHIDSIKVRRGIANTEQAAATELESESRSAAIGPLLHRKRWNSAWIGIIN